MSTSQYFDLKAKAVEFMSWIWAKILVYTGVIEVSGHVNVMIYPFVIFDLHRGAKIEIIGENVPKDTAPSSSLPVVSIGLPPNRDHLDPSPNRSTKIRLKQNARLRISTGVAIMPGTFISIWPKKSLKVENDVYIGHSSYINTKCGMLIGRNSMLGHEVTIKDYDGHPIMTHAESITHTPNESSYGGNGEPIIINENTWIGFGATILKGSILGAGSIVGAKSLLTKKNLVPPHSIYSGNPNAKLRSDRTWRKY